MADCPRNQPEETALPRTPGDSTRATRSAKPHGEAAPPGLLFDFEHEHEVGKHRRLEIVPRRLDMSGEALLLDGVGATRTAIGGMVLDIEHRELPPPSATGDPLPDTLYDAFHRKMRRQENRWLEMDVQESHETAEQLELLQNRLAMPAWQPALLRATHVAHPDDPNEMLQLRARTQRRLAQMLHSYRRMQRRAAALRHKSGSAGAGGKGRTRAPGKGALDPARDWARMYRRVDRLFVDGYGASSDEDEEAMGPAEIRAHRDRARRAACGGRITVGLTAAPQPPVFAIVAEPLQQPYVLKLTPQERREVARRGVPQKLFRYPGAAAQAAATVRRRAAVPRTFVLSEEEKRQFAQAFAEGAEGAGAGSAENPVTRPTLAAAGSPSSDAISDVPEDTPSELRLVSLGASDVSGGAPRSSPAPGLGAIVPSSPMQGGYSAAKLESTALRGVLGQGGRAGAEGVGGQIAMLQNSPHSLQSPEGVVLGNGAFVQASDATTMVQGGIREVSGAIAAGHGLPLNSSQPERNRSEANGAQPLPDQSSPAILIPRKKQRPSPESMAPNDSVSTQGPSQHSPTQTPNILIPRKKQKVRKTLQ